MQFIDFESLLNRSSEIENDFNSKTPFKYTIFENFFKADVAQLIHDSYPTIENDKWDGTTYIDQKNKFQKTTFAEGDIFNKVFAELNSDQFLSWLSKVTKIDNLLGDEKLFGGGLHQSINGAFLNIHVDYNIHPQTKFHRRLNAIVYMNKDWKEEYEGYLELWDLSNGNKNLLTKIAPSYNRCVIFETNEISYHGHPKKLNTPKGINRKSLATYYYTETRPEHEITKEHNTLYVNTEGFGGLVKRFSSGVKAFFERISK